MDLFKAVCVTVLICIAKAIVAASLCATALGADVSHRVPVGLPGDHHGTNAHTHPTELLAEPRKEGSSMRRSVTTSGRPSFVCNANRLADLRLWLTTNEITLCEFAGIAFAIVCVEKFNACWPMTALLKSCVFYFHLPE